MNSPGRYKLMTPDEIADELANYRSARARAKASKDELMRISVESCGLSQTAAKKFGDQIDAWIDGWLVGQGVKKSWPNR